MDANERQLKKIIISVNSRVFAVKKEWDRTANER